MTDRDRELARAAFRRLREFLNAEGATRRRVLVGIEKEKALREIADAHTALNAIGTAIAGQDGEEGRAGAAEAHRRLLLIIRSERGKRDRVLRDPSRRRAALKEADQALDDLALLARAAGVVDHAVQAGLFGGGHG